MGTPSITLFLLLSKLVAQSLQCQDVWCKWNYEGANMENFEPNNNPGPRCYDNPDCMGTPYYNCLDLMQQCGRWEAVSTDLRKPCCYSIPAPTGKAGIKCRMPNRSPAQELFGEGHRTYCLPILTTYDVPGYGRGMNPGSMGAGRGQGHATQQDILEQLSRIADALEDQGGIL